MTEPITNMRSCCNFLKETEFKITARMINHLNVASFTPAVRAAVYGALAFHRGTVGQAFSFIKVGKELAVNDEERVLLLHMEGILLSMAGDPEGAIERQHESLDGCRLLDDMKLTAEVLSHLSFLYQAKGDKERARKYDRQAAQLLLKKHLPKRTTTKRQEGIRK
jgi:hypothetical protein